MSTSGSPEQHYNDRQNSGPFSQMSGAPGAQFRPAEQPITTRATGAVVATIGGIVTLLSFFILPYVNLGILGSATGAQVANLLSSLESLASNFGASSATAQAGGLVFLLWLQALAGGFAALLCGIQWYQARQGHGVAKPALVIALVSGAISGLAGLLVYGGLGQFTAVLAIGYYAMLLGAIAVAIGSIMQLRA